MKYNKYGRVADYVGKAGKAVARYAVNRAVSYAANRAVSYAANRAVQSVRERMHNRLARAKLKRSVLTKGVYDRLRREALTKVRSRRAQAPNGRVRYSSGNAGYAGKFRRMNKRSGRNMDRYHRAGVVSVDEVVGLKSDPNCVYVLAEVCTGKKVIINSVAAVIRLLFTKAGISVTGWEDSPWPRLVGAGSTSSTDGDYYIGLIGSDMTAGTHTLEASCGSTADQSFKDIVGEFVDWILVWSQGYGALSTSNDKMPYAFVLYKHVGSANNLGSTDIKLSEVVLGEACVDLSASMTCKVQNRTASATGSEDEENVTNCPLQGRMYEFNGTPRCKVDAFQGSTYGAYKFQQFYTQNNGLEMFTPDNMDVTLKEPPPPGLFWNCSKSSKIRMEPGNIKTYGLSYRKVGIPIIRLWRSIKYEVTQSTNDFYNYSLFKVLGFGFEEVINLNGASSLSVAVEVERRLGVLCFEKKKKFMKESFELLSRAVQE